MMFNQWITGLHMYCFNSFPPLCLFAFLICPLLGSLVNLCLGGDLREGGEGRGRGGGVEGICHSTSCMCMAFKVKNCSGRTRA